MPKLRLLLPVPIVRGPLRGWWWLPTGGGKVLRVLGGSYEAQQSALFTRLVASGDTVLDLGANLGYYTLLASRLVGARGRVLSFEPDATNNWYLRRHARLNRCRNVRVVEAAVSDRAGRLAFDPGRGTGTGRLAEGGAVGVEAVRLDDVVAEGQLAPNALKIDVEGAEAAVISGAEEVLRRHRPLIFLSLHGAPARAACERLLRALDYRMEPLPGRGRESWDEVLGSPAERVSPLDAAAARAHP